MQYPVPSPDEKTFEDLNPLFIQVLRRLAADNAPSLRKAC